MTFEEEFPSLKEHKHISLMGEPPCYITWFTKTHIQETCLDKQRVRKLINEWVIDLSSGTGDYKKVYTTDIRSLFKRLGL